MSQLQPYQQDGQLTVVETQFVPKNQADSPSIFRRLLNFITGKGQRSVELAERMVTAKIKDQEADTAIKLLEARGKFELTLAQADETRAKAAKTDAEARNIDAETDLKKSKKAAVNELTQKSLGADKMTPAQIVARIEDTIAKIEYEHNGEVKFDPKPSPNTPKRTRKKSVRKKKK